ncbi:MAG: hypothetical protein ACI36X_01190 [Bacteroidaceae bacterium]
MEKERFKETADKYAEIIARIRESAHSLHAQVNQTYGKQHPYGYHLDMVADGVRRYGHAVCDSEDDVVPLFFGAYYHDSIEDARQTYNDVMRLAKQWMTDRQALLATEMVYALTNEKGRTRAERANDKYYQGIRETPYAPFLKLADRLANVTYSCTRTNEGKSHMAMVYRAELPHFLEAIKPDGPDKRYALPDEMVKEIHAIITQ